MSLAPSTSKFYKHCWVRFATFVRVKLKKSAHLPINLSHLLCYIAHLHGEGLGASSLLTHLSGLSHWHKLKGYSDVTHHYLVAKAIAGVRQVSPRQDLRLPISLPMLHNLIAALPKVCSCRYEYRLFQSIFALTHHGFLRIGEVVARSMRNQKGIVQMSDLHLAENNKQMILTIRKFKHSAKQGPQNIVIKRSADIPKQFCPTQLIRKYLALRSKLPGPLFCWRDNMPCTSRSFDAKLKEVLRACNYSSKHFKGHSFRIGAASEAAAKGCSDSQIRNLGRWQSDAFKKYIRIANL